MSWTISSISGRHRTYFHPLVFLQTDVTALQTQRGLVIFGQKTAPSNSLVQRFLWKNRIFEALFQQDNHIVQMRHMALSICLIKLYQTTMRKNFHFLFLTTLSLTSTHIFLPSLFLFSGKFCSRKINCHFLSSSEKLSTAKVIWNLIILVLRIIPMSYFL